LFNGLLEFFDNDTSGTWTTDTPRYFIWNNADGTWGAVGKGGSGLPEGSEFATGFVRKDILGRVFNSAWGSGLI